MYKHLAGAAALTLALASFVAPGANGTPVTPVSVTVQWGGQECVQLEWPTGDGPTCLPGRTVTVKQFVRSGDVVGVRAHTSMNPDVPWTSCRVETMSGRVIVNKGAIREQPRYGGYTADCMGRAK